MVILIVGKTCSGKDTVAHHIAERYGFHRIVTYTTRPMRADDVQGVSHHFITVEERKQYSDEELFSPTEIAGYEYFMLKSQFLSGDVVCIVDPKGVEDVKALGVEYGVIYVEAPEAMILCRAEERGTNINVVMERLNAERNRFDSYRDSATYNYRINNIQTVRALKIKVDSCMACFGYSPYEKEAI